MQRVLLKGLLVALPVLFCAAFAAPQPVEARVGSGPTLGSAQPPKPGIRLRANRANAVNRRLGGIRTGKFRPGFDKPDFPDKIPHPDHDRGGVFFPGYWGLGDSQTNIYLPPATPSSGDGQDAAGPQPLFQSPGAKWIQVDDGSNGKRSNQPVEADEGNCLSVRKEMVIDGTTIEAFGKTCQQADGSWKLIPDDS